MFDNPETNDPPPPFDVGAYPEDTCFHERRDGLDRRAREAPKPTAEPSPERRRVERRRRIDPTTFEKQYTVDELEFMNAMQRFKVQSGKPFPTYSEVLRVARTLGYARPDEAD